MVLPASSTALVGDINHNRRDELRQRLRRTLGKRGNIQIYPQRDKDIKLKCEIVNTEKK